MSRAVRRSNTLRPCRDTADENGKGEIPCHTTVQRITRLSNKAPNKPLKKDLVRRILTLCQCQMLTLIHPVKSQWGHHFLLTDEKLGQAKNSCITIVLKTITKTAISLGNKSA